MAARGSRRHRRHNDGIGIIAVAGQGAELQDGFGAVEAPPGPGDFHPVLDEPPGRSFYKAAGHRPAGLEEGGVVQVVLLVFQVAGAFAGSGALGGAVSPGRGAAADPGTDIAVLPGQDFAVCSRTQARAPGSPG